MEVALVHAMWRQLLVDIILVEAGSCNFSSHRSQPRCQCFAAGINVKVLYAAGAPLYLSLAGSCCNGPYSLSSIWGAVLTSYLQIGSIYDGSYYDTGPFINLPILGTVV